MTDGLLVHKNGVKCRDETSGGTTGGPAEGGVRPTKPPRGASSLDGGGGGGGGCWRVPCYA